MAGSNDNEGAALDGTTQRARIILVAGQSSQRTREVLDTLRGLPERTSQQLCAPLTAGVTHNFALDVASVIGPAYEGSVIQAGVLEIYGSNALCDHSGEPLWRSPPLTADWQTFCVSVTPTEDLTYLTLQAPVQAGVKSAVLVDNFRLSPECGDAVVVDP